jgi:hypothetical protein
MLVHGKTEPFFFFFLYESSNTFFYFRSRELQLGTCPNLFDKEFLHVAALYWCNPFELIFTSLDDFLKFFYNFIKWPKVLWLNGCRKLHVHHSFIKMLTQVYKYLVFFIFSILRYSGPFFQIVQWPLYSSEFFLYQHTNTILFFITCLLNFCDVIDLILYLSPLLMPFQYLFMQNW